MFDAPSYILGKKAGGGSAPVLQDKEVTITENGETTVTADSGYDGLSSVDVTTNVPQPSGKITITQNGTDIDVSSYATADVNVSSGMSEYFRNVDGTITSSSSAPGYTKIIKKIGETITSFPDNSNYYFYNCSAENIVINSNINTSNITGMNYMFSQIKVQTLDLSNFNISNVNYAQATFFYCENLKTLDLSNFKNSKGIDMPNFFQNCNNLETINFNNWNVSNANNLNSMFDGCSKLSSLDLSGLKIKTTSNLGNMFKNCNLLLHLDIRNFVLSTHTGNRNNMFGSSTAGIPDNCEIIVKDDTEKSWFNTNFSRFTNVKTVAEYEAS